VAAALIAGGCSSHRSRALSSPGLTLSLPSGWHGVEGPGQLQAADFPLSSSVLSSAARAHVERGHVHLIVWDNGPAITNLGRNQSSASGPLRFRQGDLSTAIEGFPLDHAFAFREINFRGELLEVVADLGPKPLAPGRLREANRVLASLSVTPPRVIRPRGGILERDGVALRLLPGWDGWIEVPASHIAANFVFVANRGATRVVLSDEHPVFPEHQAGLPLRLSRYSDGQGHRLALVDGHGIEASATFSSESGFAEAERLLATLRIDPQPWTLSLCDFSLRVPGLWKAGVRRRGGCYLVVTLRADGMRAVLQELRPSERGTGRVITRAGRRFLVQVTPSDRRAAADAVVETLRAKPRG
jgi:hypothetical protein